MSDEPIYTSPTTMYDYSGYYDENTSDFAPCDPIDVRSFGKVYLPTLYSLVFILGFIGNGLVVCVLVKYRHQTNLADMCLFNLALSDLLFVLTLPFFSHYAVVSRWTFGDFMCRFTSASHNTGFFSSIFFMVVMALDRYIVVMHSCKVMNYRTLKAGVILTVLVWVLSISVSLPSFILTKVTNESHKELCMNVSDSNWRLYNLIATNILGLVIPLLVMLFCYIRIIPTVVKMKFTKRYRAIKLTIVIMIAFFLFWTPYNVSIFLNFLHSQGILKGECQLDTNLKLAVTVTEAVAFTHCCLNPIIYAFVGQKFMKRVVRLLRGWVPWIPFARDLSESSYRKSSLVSRSSDVTSTFVN